MYGLVHRAIQDLVTSRFGEQAWSEIRAKAGVEADSFVAMQSYDDGLTFRIVQATSEVLELPVPQVLEAFGEYWTVYTIEEGYGELLELMGSSLEEFLENLDSMHSRIATAMPNLVPPSFDRESQADGSSILHYRSEREGLAPMVLGLLRGLGPRFGVDLQVEQLPQVEPGVERFHLRAA